MLVMATLTVKLRDLAIVKLTMEGAGRIPGMAGHILPARMMVVNVRMGSKVMESTNAKILMNARKGLHASARNANARTHGEAMNAVAVAACFI